MGTGSWRYLHNVLVLLFHLSGARSSSERSTFQKGRSFNVCWVFLRGFPWQFRQSAYLKVLTFVEHSVYVNIYLQFFHVSRWQSSIKCTHWSNKLHKVQLRMDPQTIRCKKTRTSNQIPCDFSSQNTFFPIPRHVPCDLSQPLQLEPYPQSSSHSPHPAQWAPKAASS